MGGSGRLLRSPSPPYEYNNNNRIEKVQLQKAGLTCGLSLRIYESPSQNWPIIGRSYVLSRLLTTAADPRKLVIHISNIECDRLARSNLVQTMLNSS